jgi:tRNA-dihydrouridine synthase B
MKKLKIGNVTLKNQLFLAPMVEVTDLPYRLISQDAGAAMTYIEMLNISAIINENRNTKNLMKTCKEDCPAGIQITGNNVSDFKRVLPYLKPYDIIDINCGCPSIRITGNQSGSYLLRNPAKIGVMIKTLKDVGYNVTAKIRLGFKKNNVMKVSRIIEKSGADAITVHPRMAYAGSSVPAEWKWIKVVKDNVGIPVIGNGDINSPKRAEEMLNITDGAMIARAAIGTPIIFSDIIHYLKTGKEREFDFMKNFSYFKKYLAFEKKYDVIDIPRIKYIGSNFIQNIHGAAKHRFNFMSLKSYDEILEFTNHFDPDLYHTSTRKT